MSVQQGSVIELIEENKRALVLSRNFFNQTGLCVVCPFVPEAAQDPLHFPVAAGKHRGVALCEQLRTLDLKARFYRTLGVLPFEAVQDITDAVQDIFNYYPYG